LVAQSDDTMALTMEPLQERLDALLESRESPVMRDVLA
jgi:hypothetical protein